MDAIFTHLDHPLVELNRGAQAGNASHRFELRERRERFVPPKKMRADLRGMSFEERREHKKRLQRMRRLAAQRNWNMNYASIRLDPGDGIIYAATDCVCQAFGVTREEIRGAARPIRLSEPRLVLYWLLRRHAKLKFLGIALFVGRREHTSVTHGIKSIERKMGSDAALRSHVNKIDQLLSSLFSSKREAA